VNFFLLLHKKEDILNNACTVYKDDGPYIDYGPIPYYGSDWGSSTVWLPIFFKISYFWVQQKK